MIITCNYQHVSRHVPLVAARWERALVDGLAASSKARKRSVAPPLCGQTARQLKAPSKTCNSEPRRSNERSKGT